MKYFIIHILFLVLLPLTVLSQPVISLRVKGMIGPAVADYIHRGISKAVAIHAECVIIHLNTPGGLLQSTRTIVSDILDAPVPVIVFVYPGGSQAGSAGVFLTLAAHVAVMAPGTNIGAAHPVYSTGQPDTVMNEKITNDAIAFITTIAEKRHRNVEWAIASVRQSKSITENEALKMNVINFIAQNDQELLHYINGKTLTVSAGSKTIHINNASIKEVEMTWFEKLLHTISDPNIAYVLMMLGIYGLLFEVFNPGVFFPGIVGGICFVLALYALNTLPVNYAGAALIVLAVLLFILEIKIISHGVLAIGGIIAMILGSMMLIQTGQEWDIAGVSWSIILPSVIITSIFFLFVVGMGLKAQRLKPASGIQAMVGETGKVITALQPKGTVIVHGEIWNAISQKEDFIYEGARIRVLSIENFTLYVESIDT
jgi:membrane-bound serine protease (ClpP class)